MTIDASLVEYFATREKHRTNQVIAVLARMTKREQALVREVAVMANVRGSRWDERPPNDSIVLMETIAACLSMPDLYPTIARIARAAARRTTGPDQVPTELTEGDN